MPLPTTAAHWSSNVDDKWGTTQDLRTADDDGDDGPADMEEVWAAQEEREQRRRARDAAEDVRRESRDQMQADMDQVLAEYLPDFNKDDAQPQETVHRSKAVREKLRRRDEQSRRESTGATTVSRRARPAAAPRASGHKRARGEDEPRASRASAALPRDDLTPEERAAQRKQVNAELEKREERAKRKELEIMHGGRYYRMKDEAVERDRAMRNARRNKTDGREHLDKAIRSEELDVLETRQTRVKKIVHDFYAAHEPHRAIGEIVTLVPQHNIGYIELLGDEGSLPKSLATDTVFFKNNARKLLFDGVTLLHQPLMAGDIVEFEFVRNYLGQEIKDGQRHRDVTEEVRWVAVNLKLRSAVEDAIPGSSQLIPLEVRRYMLNLISLIEAGSDLALYTKISMEFEVWKRILNEPFTNKPHGGLMEWHVLLILAIASRSWLENANMPLLLWAFFNSFHKTRFMVEVLPHLLSSTVLPPSALVQLAQFLYLFKKHTTKDVSQIHGLLREAAKVQKDAKLEAQLQAALEKLAKLSGKASEPFVDLLSEACNKGYNTLRVKDRSELEEVDAILDAERTGHERGVDGLRILPTLSELADEDAFDPKRLPPNRPEGSWGTPDTYTRAAFELLRADTYKEFQFSMHHKCFNWHQYETSTDVEYKREVGRPTSFMKLVGIMGVNYTGAAVSIAGRLTYTVRFRMFEAMAEAWVMKMYEKGNLVGLSVDRFKSTVWWAVVSHRDQVLLSQGIVGLEFISGDPLDLQARLQALQRKGQDSECWIVEASTVFFSGYRPVLEALQLFSRKATEEGHCPFEDFLVYGRDKPTMPPWVNNNKEDFMKELQHCTEEHTFDPSQERALRGLQNSFLLVQGPPGTGKSYTGVKMVDVILRTRYAALDRINRLPVKGQIQEKMTKAVESSKHYTKLQQEVEKLKATVMELKVKRNKCSSSADKKKFRQAIEKVLTDREKKKNIMREIDNEQSQLFADLMRLEQERERLMEDFHKDSGPIQIITYKNHSLDEFMMDVMPSVKRSEVDPSRREGLVRFGSRSQCEELDQYNVREVVKRFEIDPNLQTYSRQLASALRAKVDRLKSLGAEISHLQAGNLTPECLTSNMTTAQARHFGEVSESRIENWRGMPYAEVLVSLNDATRAALEEDKIREGDDDDDSDDGMPKVSDLQNNRDIYQTKEDQEREDFSRVKFMAAFSPVLPDSTGPKPSALSFDVDAVDDLDSLTRDERDEVAKHWTKKHLSEVMEQYQRLKGEYIYICSAQYEFRQQSKVDALQHCQVIGLTVTGCTINKELLNNIQPTVLIVEEAAEILESQIISCLNQSTIQQVVLVGDHKQLRPIVRNYPIARECKLDLSLFERMANNNIPVHNLTNQRRMVPEISQFVRPLYRQLIDDPCLKPRKMLCGGSKEIRDAGDIPGLGKPVWFWSHEQPEEKSSVGLSVVNPVEVKMVVWLVKYFTARGMDLSQMTVLTPYKGQLRELRDALTYADCHRPDMVCTVDRFQGDENDLMIVSMVRTSTLTEFIKAPDRMCVLLSRARFGMVIIGSGTLLDSPEVPHWKQTMSTLAQRDWVGSKFPMRCDRHPHVRTPGLDVLELMHGETAEVKIDGFCREVCGSPYKECLQPGRHKCARTCHEGAHQVCDHICGKVLGCGHVCRQACGDCFTSGCRCVQPITMPSEECGVYRVTPEGDWQMFPHILTKNGCGSAYRACKREIYKRLGCGHYVQTTCHRVRSGAFNADQICMSCQKGEPASTIPEYIDTLEEPPATFIAQIHERQAATGAAAAIDASRQAYADALDGLDLLVKHEPTSAGDADFDPVTPVTHTDLQASADAARQPSDDGEEPPAKRARQE